MTRYKSLKDRAQDQPADEWLAHECRYVKKDLTPNQRAFGDYTLAAGHVSFETESEWGAYWIGVKCAGLWATYRAIDLAGRLQIVLGREVYAVEPFVDYATFVARSAEIYPTGVESLAFVTGVRGAALYKAFQSSKPSRA